MDVSDMLDELTPEQFLEWSVADRIGVLDGDEWGRMGTLAAVIHNEFARVRAMISKQRNVKDFHTPSDYMPDEMKPKKEKKSDGFAEFQAEVRRQK